MEMGGKKGVFFMNKFLFLILLLPFLLFGQTVLIDEDFEDQDADAPLVMYDVLDYNGDGHNSTYSAHGNHYGTADDMIAILSGMSSYLDNGIYFRYWVKYASDYLWPGDDGLFDAGDYDATDILSADSTVYFRHEGNNSIVTIITTNTVTRGSWAGLRFRWSVENNIIGVKINDNSWENDSDDDVVTSLTSEKTRLSIGDDTNNTGEFHGHADDVTLYDTYDGGWNGE